MPYEFFIWNDLHSTLSTEAHNAGQKINELESVLRASFDIKNYKYTKNGTWKNHLSDCRPTTSILLSLTITCWLDVNMLSMVWWLAKMKTTEGTAWKIWQLESCINTSCKSTHRSQNKRWYISSTKERIPWTGTNGYNHLTDQQCRWKSTLTELTRIKLRQKVELQKILN